MAHIFLINKNTSHSLRTFFHSEVVVSISLLLDSIPATFTKMSTPLAPSFSRPLSPPTLTASSSATLIAIPTHLDGRVAVNSSHLDLFKPTIFVLLVQPMIYKSHHRLIQSLQLLARPCLLLKLT